MWAYIAAIGLTGGLLFGAFEIGARTAASEAAAAVSESRAIAAEKSLQLERANTQAAESSARAIAATKAAERERALRVSATALAAGLDRCVRPVSVRDVRNEAIARTYSSAGGGNSAGTGDVPSRLPTVAAGSGKQ